MPPFRQRLSGNKGGTLYALLSPEADSRAMENTPLTLAANSRMNRKSLFISVGYLAIAALCVAAPPARAQNLSEALQQAYSRSEEIAKAQAQLDSDQAGIVISKAGGLPTVGTSVQLTETLAGSSTNTGKVNVSGEVNMPLFQGGAVKNGVRAARSRSAASSFTVAATEMAVFNAVVAAYADVLRDQRIVELSRNNLRSLTTTLNATRARFRARDLTRTDVSQAESRAALARGELEAAEAQLAGAIEEFRRLTGLEVTRLAPLPPLADLPASAEMAVAAALDENPQLTAAKALLESQRYEVKAARAEALPKVSAVLNGRYSDRQLQPTIPNDSRFGATVGVAMSMSLFRGGQVPARVNQATAREMQAVQEVQGIERVLIARARSEYANWRASREVVAASEQAVTATQQALGGVRAENDVGSRTILDILNAEQELRNAQVQLANAERDSYLAAFSLLATMGRAQARNLGISQSSKREVAADGNSLADGASAEDTSVGATVGAASAQLAVEPEALVPLSPPATAPLPTPTPKTSPSPPPDTAARPAPVAAKTATGAGTTRGFQIPSTHWVIQLAAHESAAAAKAHWAEAKGKVAKTVPGATALVAVAANSPTTVYRLAIGPFAEFTEAETACADLRVGGQSCIVRRAATFGTVQWADMIETRKTGR